jgi:hypothetical protein
LAAVGGTLLVIGLMATNLPAARVAFALAICLLLPGFGWARKMRLADLGDTVALAIVLSMCMTVVVGTAMVVSGFSPEWGLAALAGVALAGFVPARLLLDRASAAVQLRMPGFGDDEGARAGWYPRETQEQAQQGRTPSAVTASRASAAWVDRCTDVKRRAEEARAREAAAGQAAMGQWISWCQLTQPLTKRQDPGVDPMRMRCFGGEPAGLLFAILARSSGHEANVYEQAPPAESFGWGVVFWDDQPRQLDAHGAGTGRLVHEQASTWTDQVIEVTGRDPVRIPRFGYCLRCRRLLELLRSQATAVGVHIEVGRVTDVDAVARGADLVIASDRVNSTLRRQQAGFSTWVTRLRNKYILGSDLVAVRWPGLGPTAADAAEVPSAWWGSIRRPACDS